MVKAFLMRAGTSLLRVLPRRLVRLAVLATGDACWLLLGNRRRILDSNLLHTAPDADPRTRRRLTRATFRNLVQCTTDLLGVPLMSRGEVLALVDGRGGEHLDGALAQGRGAILVTGHVGNWDLAGVCLAAAGYPAHAVIEPAEPALAAAYERLRGATGLKVLPLGSGMLSAYRALRRGGLLLLVGDRAIGDPGREVAYGHGRRMASRGPAELACRSGAPVLVGYLVLNPDRSGPRYLGCIEPLVTDPGDDPIALTRTINARLSGIVLKFPDQWFVFQPDWVSDRS
jgi:KDO2-lipid IV(A) lauroyltransferase